MSWNPFSDAWDWLSNGFESFGNDLWNFGSGVMDFVDPSGALHTTDRQRLADQTNQWNLYSSQQSLKHQMEYDDWAQQFSEENAAWQKNFAERQFQEQSDLARSPFSTLLADASKNGISPMAALGQNVGSVSVGSSTPSAGNSSVGNNQAAIHLSNLNTLPSLMQTLSSSVLGKRQQDLTKEMFDEDLHYKYKALDVQQSMAAERNKVHYAAQQILSDFNSHKKELDLKNYELTRNLNEQQIAELQGQLLALRGAYEKDMQEIDYMKNKSENEKQALKQERERTWVQAISGVLGSIIGAVGSVIRSK